MNRTAQLTLAIVVLLTGCMGVALVGRSADWSPFALTIIGAMAGAIFGAMVTLAIIEGDQ